MPFFPPIPTRTPFLESPPPRPGEPPKPTFGFVTEPWILWFQEIATWLQQSARRLSSVILPATGAADLSAAISPTAIPTGDLATTRYRLTYYARITTAASVSSSLTVTLAWVDGGVTCTFSGAAITGNTTATTQSGTIMVNSDGASAVSYSTTWASVGAPSATYQLTVIAEGLA